MPYSTAARSRLQDAFLALLPHIETARVAHHVPALSLAVVADQTILWSGGFGFADQARLARFVRKTLSFSKSVLMHEVCLLLFLHRYNRERAILLK